MAQAWNWLWLTVAFLAEVAALVALGHWGWVTGAGAVGLLLAVATPAVAGILWGLFAAPKAVVRIPALVALVKVLVFGSAVASLVVTGHPWTAVVLGVAAAASALLSTPPVVAPPVVSASAAG